jgi:uncharacterized membrane protein
MKFLRTTLAGGILFLVPVIVVAVIAEKAFRLAHKIVFPLASKLPVDSVLGFETPKVMAVMLIVVACFLAGLFARLGAAKKLVDWLESSILSNLPGYDFVKGLGAGLLGVESKQASEVVLARMEEAWQLAFLIERIDAGQMAVFVPGAPNPQSGSVFFLTADRVRPAGITAQAALKCLRRMGAGSGALLRDPLRAPDVAVAASNRLAS